MRFKVGQIINSKATSFYGRLISFRNKLIYGKEHNWTHAAIITEVKNDKVLVHEAIRNGFVKRYYDKSELLIKLKQKEIIIGETKIKLKNVKKYAEKYEGRGYGFLDIFHIILYWLFGTKAKFLFTGSQYLICSEAVSRILYDASNKKINFEKEFLIPYDLIEPMHLWQSKQIRWEKYRELRYLHDILYAVL